MTLAVVSFVSANRMLAGRHCSIAVGDRVKFHPAGTISFYTGAVLGIELDQIIVRVLVSHTGRGNTGIHRWRNGQIVRVCFATDVYEIIRAAALPPMTGLASA